MAVPGAIQCPLCVHEFRLSAFTIWLPKRGHPHNRMFFLLLILSGPFRYSHYSVPLRNMLFCATDRFNLPPLNDQTVFHAPILHPPPRRVQPKMKLLFTCLQGPATPTLPASQTKRRE
jgi:hypothetical protein